MCRQVVSDAWPCDIFFVKEKNKNKVLTRPQGNRYLKIAESNPTAYSCDNNTGQTS